MSNEHTRDRGNLFENSEKKKPSQPDLQGDCTIDMTAYEIRGWRRGDQLALSFAPPRGDHNTYPPDVFRGALDPAPNRPARGNVRGAKEPEPVATPAWSGDIAGDEAAYTVRAFEKRGKHGLYFTLSFERLERSASTELSD
jgi:hypothetical protein